MSWDAIVIGAGHNALVCACYLARDGMRVLVLEKRDRVGGMADTTELLPGVRVPTLAHTVGRLRPAVARELRLTDHGLRLVQPDAHLFAPQPDGGALTLWGSVERTAAEMAAGKSIAAADGNAYLLADAKYRGLAGALGALMSATPPDLASPTLADALTGLKQGLRARSRAGADAADLLRVLPMAVSDLVAEWFASDALRAAVAYRGVLFSSFGPLAPGTAGILLSDGAGNEGGLAGQAVFARGGPGAVGEALAAAARALGVEIRTGAAGGGRPPRRGVGGWDHAGGGRGDRRSRCGLRRRPKDNAARLDLARGGRPAAWLARGQHSRQRRDGKGQPRAV